MLTQDPIGLAGGVNLYSYAGNNPIAFSDPYGLLAELLDPPPGKPPVRVPNGGPSNDWKWNPDSQNKRGGTWGPTQTLPGQSQPSASWEDAKGKGIGHWDVDDGLGNRERVNEKGEPITEEEAHGGQPGASEGNGGAESGQWDKFVKALGEVLHGIAREVVKWPSPLPPVRIPTNVPSWR